MTGNTCSNLVFIYNPATKNWTYHNITQGAPQPRTGASVATFLDTLYVFGGECNGDIFNDTWAFSLSLRTWSQKTTGLARVSNASAVVASNGTMYVFGGATSSGATRNLYTYDTQAGNWSNITPVASPSARQRASITVSGYRLFLFGGTNGMTYYNDTWQLVIEKDCKQLSCLDCVKSVSCGWCNGNGFCLVGNSSLSELGVCSGQSYTKSALQCPEEGFPSWAIALIVIGGVVLIGIIVFAIMKVRSGRPEYTRIDQ